MVEKEKAEEPNEKKNEMQNYLLSKAWITRSFRAWTFSSSGPSGVKLSVIQGHLIVQGHTGLRYLQ